MTSRDWHVTWRSVIVPLLAPEARLRTAVMPKSSTNSNKDDQKWLPLADRKTKYEIE